MVRQRSRNTLEEVYGTKFDAAKSQANTNNKNIKDHGYIITSNMPYNTTILPPPTSAANCGLSPAAMNTSRRKSARPNMKNGPGTANKLHIKEEKDDSKKENNMKIKSTRGGNDKWQYNSSTTHQYDNKTYRAQNENRKDPQAHGDGQQHHHQNRSNQQHHQNHNHNHSYNNHHHHHHHDDDKDDDTEEFFELIRKTVEGSIGKSVSELLNRNFRELGAKVDRFSSELKNTNEMLNKIQVDLNNKIVHYGEENSRHFRYLCMKSEYDKMFYQHQTMMTAQVVSSDTSQTLEKKISSAQSNANPVPKKNKETIDGDSSNAPCTCRSTTNQAATTKSKEPQKSSSDDNNVSEKSSDVGMREVLDHIQRFCTQLQSKEKKSDQRPSVSQVNNNGAIDGLTAVRLMESYMQKNGVNINPQIFGGIDDDDDDDDDDALGLSSDGMTPRSDDEQQMQNYGGMTMRTSSSKRAGICGGGGDA